VTAAVETYSPARDWAAANRAVLDLELHALRLRCRRRALWLRSTWRSDPLEEFQALVVSDAQADRLLRGTDAAAEERFYREDAEARELSTRLTEIEAQAREAAAALAEDDVPTALDSLVGVFGLTEDDRSVFLACLAPQLDSSFERIYAYIHDDVARTHATPQLMTDLFGGGARDALFGGAPLRRFALVVPDEAWVGQLIGRPLYVDERMTEFVLGVNRLDSALDHVVRLRIPPRLQAAESFEGLEQMLASRFAAGDLPVINLVGEASTRPAAAAQVASRLGLHLATLSLDALPADVGERARILRLLERDATLLGLALYVEADDVGPVEWLNVVVMAGSGDRIRIQRETIPVRLRTLDAATRTALWERALEGVPHSTDGIDELVQQFEFGPETIAESVSSARTRALLRLDGAGEIELRDLWEAAREHVGSRLDDVADRIQPAYVWDDIVLPEDVALQLRELAAQVAQRSHVYEAWGFGAKLTRGRGTAALFAGASGTGKTMAAEVLANHLSLDLYRIDLAGIVSKYIGETEKNLRRLFAAAEESGVVLFFDEADALFGKRSEVRDSHDRYANIEINYLLQKMEDYRGLAILATNMKTLVDPAFMRRLRFVIDFPLPDTEHRRKIWERAFPPAAAVDGLDYEFLARLEITGASIKSIALNAAFLAADASSPITMGHVLRAARREYSKIEKLVNENEFRPYELALAGGMA